ncbi:MAG: LysM peptidoglycan-binding domain-containing protein [Bacteroidales bacterium]|nr:LysM peptidoglycan-binding domain-containing protein [Bacteroidales bacterium]
MRTRNFTLVFILLLFSALGLYGQRLTRQQYIDKYKDIAIKQMHKHKIPASIILAQACLESNNGNSTLAVKANNHFGIKCHDGWKGKKIRQNDDKRRECFRKYDKAIDSFTDHSLFLTTRPRYNSLFDLPITDYKSWAHGLKAAGYATNRKYASLLIDIIEEFELYKYDTGEAYDKSKAGSKAAKRAAKLQAKRQKLEKKAAKAAKRAQKANFKYYEYTGETPQTTVKTLADAVQAPKGEVNILMYKVKQGDTLYSIARKHGITVDDIYRLNPGIKATDLKIGTELKLR